MGSIQSIERQFQIPSKLTGTLLSARDIGYVIFVVFLAYLGGRGNRARWLGGGAVAIGVACIMLSSPHWLFPRKEMKATEPIVRQLMRPPPSFYFSNVSAAEVLSFPPVALNLPDGMREKILAEVPGQNSRRKRQIGQPEDILALIQEYDLGKKPAPEFIEDLRVLLVTPLESKIVERMLKAATSPVGSCNPMVNKFRKLLDNMKCEAKEPNNAAISIIFIALLITGVAHTLPGALGLPLIDDNVKKSNAPLYFGKLPFEFQ